MNDITLLPFCECGCGQRVSKLGNKWIHNHHLRGENNHFYGKKHTPESLKLMSDSHIEYWSNPTNRDTQSERKIEHFKDQNNRDKISNALKEYYKNNQEVLDEISKRMIDYWSDPANQDAQSERRIEYFKKHPEKGSEHSIWLIEWWSNQNNRDKMSKIRLNSNAAQELYDMMRGGYDICEHHYIYDHANSEKYTMEVTRSKHQQIHMWMKKSEIIVPHINENPNRSEVNNDRQSTNNPIREV